MTFKSRRDEFIAWWDDDSKFDLGNTERQKYRNYCVFAQQFAQWAENLVTDAGGSLSLVAIQQAKIQLLDKYFEWRASVPKNHRDRVGSSGHYCIFQVFVSAYDTLRMVELSLTPPLFVGLGSSFRPEPRGIVIGEEADFESE